MYTSVYGQCVDHQCHVQEMYSFAHVYMIACVFVRLSLVCVVCCSVMCCVVV